MPNYIQGTAHLGNPQKKLFFSDPTTKALNPTPLSSLVVIFFFGTFVELQKSSFSLVVWPQPPPLIVVRPLKNDFFAASLIL